MMPNFFNNLAKSSKKISPERIIINNLGNCQAPNIDNTTIGSHTTKAIHIEMSECDNGIYNLTFCISTIYV